MPEDLKNVVLEIGSQMIKLAGKGEDEEKNKQVMLDTIKSGKAFEKFKEMVQNQGGDVSFLDDTSKFEKSKFIFEVRSLKDGIVKEINAESVGKIACSLGAGRIKKENTIDMSVGVVLNKKVSNYVQKDELLATIYANDEKKGIKAKEAMEKIYIVN